MDLILPPCSIILHCWQRVNNLVGRKEFLFFIKKNLFIYFFGCFYFSFFYFFFFFFHFHYCFYLFLYVYFIFLLRIQLFFFFFFLFLLRVKFFFSSRRMSLSVAGGFGYSESLSRHEWTLCTVFLNGRLGPKPPSRAFSSSAT